MMVLDRLWMSWMERLYEDDVEEEEREDCECHRHYVWVQDPDEMDLQTPFLTFYPMTPANSPC